MFNNAGWNGRATDYASRLDEYKESVSTLFPDLPKELIDARSVSETDALALGLLLECYLQEVTVLDIGTFVGTSAFFFASHPRVTVVISVDPNPMIAEEINDESQVAGAKIAPSALRDLRVLDVARAVLARFPSENRNVRLYEGAPATDGTGITDELSGGPQRLEALVSELPKESSFVAFLNGPHTREGIHADLRAVFDKNPRAVAILDNCRHPSGPFVQAGVVTFMESARHEYEFHLLGDLGPAIATSNLGIVYQKAASSSDVRRALAEFTELFTERLDLLWLMRREEELISTVNHYKEAANEAARLQERNIGLEEYNAKLRERISQSSERSEGLRKRIDQLKRHADQLKKRIDRLEQRKAGLEERNLELKQENMQLHVYRSSRRYRIADAVAEGLRWIPGAAGRARRRSE
jgi:hypothetical protein